MKSNVTPLFPGTGKYENTLNWLIQTTPEGTQYPHVKRPQAIFYVATREEVEKLDISRFLANFGPQIPADKMREYQGKIFWAVDGFDTDPSELHELQQVRDYYAEAHRNWPAWLFLSDLRSPCLQMVARCIIHSVATTNPSLRETNEFLRAFFLWSLPTSGRCYKYSGISRSEAVKHLQNAAKYLGILE